MSYDVDVAIVGGGPGGATAGAFLADAGHRVAIFERARFDTRRIGESLLPMVVPILDRLGLGGPQPCLLRKDGASFYDGVTGAAAAHPFASGLPSSSAAAWHTHRPAFDTLLLDRARMAGADVRQGEQVRRIEVAENRVVVETKPGTTVVARYVIDASGPRAFLGRRNRTIEPIPGVGRAAAWVHYDGLRPDTAAELAETGNIIIVYLEDGWGWLIPLPDRQLSAGVVSRDQGLDADVYEASLGRLSLVRRLTEGSTRSDPALVGNFSFRNTAPFGSRYACVGDAAGFLDPVFSTGVSLAMASAERIAATLGAALQGGTEAESALMDPVAAWLEVGYERFLGLIRLFYETRLLRRLVFHDDPDPTLRAGLISMLAGEVWSDDNPFWVKMGRHAARTLDERRAKAGE